MRLGTAGSSSSSLGFTLRCRGAAALPILALLIVLCVSAIALVTWWGGGWWVLGGQWRGRDMVDKQEGQAIVQGGVWGMGQ
jgi:hypothetical protein